MVKYAGSFYFLIRLPCCWVPLPLPKTNAALHPGKNALNAVSLQQRCKLLSRLFKNHTYPVKNNLWILKICRQ